MLATKVRPSVASPSAPHIDAAEARWAARELAGLIEKVGDESPVAVVLRQARREVASLVAAPGNATVIGPFRIAA